MRKLKKIDNEKKDLVTVLIAAYNHEKFVQETIRSLINQTYKKIELIIIDDGSPDKTFEKMLELKPECEKRFVRTIMETQPNQGIAATSNRLRSMAEGEYIYAISSDDVVADKRAIEILHDFLAKNPDFGLVTGDQDYIDQDSKPIKPESLPSGASTAVRREISYRSELLHKVYSQLIGDRWDVANLPYIKYSDFWYSNLVPNGYLFRHKCLKMMLPHNINICNIEDMYMHYQLTKFSKEKILDKVLFHYRVHQNNYSNSNWHRNYVETRGLRFYEMYLLETYYKRSKVVDEDCLRAPNFKNIKKEWDICKKSKYWNEKYYCRHNPEVLKQGWIPLVHYLSWGVEEGRCPSAYFEGKKIVRGVNPIMAKRTLSLKNKLRYKIWKHIKKKLNKKIEKLSRSATYLDKIRYKIFKKLSKKLSKKNLISDVSADLKRFKEYISTKLPKNKVAILHEEMTSFSEYKQKMENELSSLNCNLQRTNKLVEQEILKIKDILILQILFPDIIKNMLPKYDFLETNSMLYNAMERSFFQTKEIQALKNDFVSKLAAILENIYKVAGGITSTQYASIRQDFINKGISVEQNTWRMCCNLLQAHYVNHPEFEKINQEIENGSFRNWGEYFWRLYLIFCIYKKEFSLAEKIFKFYDKNYGDNCIKKHLVIASFAYEQGKKDSIYKKANVIYKKLQDAEENHLLEEMLKDKTVAIVGNGPQQQGKKTGAEIDNHDIVFRFNYYANTEEYYEDLGKKTDIWVNWVRYPLNQRPIAKLKAIVVATDIYTWDTILPDNPTYWDDLYDFVQDGGLILSYPYDIRGDMYNQINIPTSGFSFVYWIKKIKQDLKMSDCYAFSFTEETLSNDVSQTWFHFDGLAFTTKNLDHSLLKEKEILSALF